jgi:multiple sugar transport system substrate-binding protein
VLLAACGPKATPAPAPKQEAAPTAAPAAQAAGPAAKPQGTLTVWGWDEPVCEQFNDAFMDTYPDVKINYSASDVLTNFIAVLASGVGEVDVCWSDSNTYKQFASTGQLVDMTERMEEFHEGMAEFLWDMGFWHGKIYGCTRRYAPNFLFYRTDIFEEAGVTEAPATIDEYIEAGKKIQEKDPERYLDIYIGAGTWSAWYETLMGLGPNRWIWDEDGNVTLGSPENVEVLETFIKVYKSGVIVNSKYWSPEWLDDLSTGKCCSILGEYWFGQEPERFPEQKGLWAMAKPPAIKEGGTRASDSRTSNWYIVPKISKNVDLAWEYIKFTAYNPTNEAIQNTIDFEWVIPSWGPMNEPPLGNRVNPFFGEPVRSQAAEWAKEAVVLNCPPEFNDSQKAMFVEVMKAATGEKTPQQAMDDAKKQVEELMSKRPPFPG